MNGVGAGDLLIRMVVSLGVVLLLVLGAYTVIRRRQGFTKTPRRVASRSTGVSALRRGRSGAGPLGKAGLRIVGRIGVSRTSSVIAVQFADRVYMVGASEQTGPAVLAELDLESWNAANHVSDEPTSLRSEPVDPAKRSNLLDALREATTRRG